MTPFAKLMTARHDAWIARDLDAGAEEIARLDRIVSEAEAELDRAEAAKEAAEQKAATPAPGFTFTRVGDRLAEGLKPINWLVRSYVEADSLALLFGDPAAGKSFIAIDLACCIATGTPWHSNRTTPGAVFYIAGEGQNGLDRRFAAWSQGNEIPLSGAPLFSSSRPAMLCNAKGAADVANAVEGIAEREGRNPSLIVVDTLARNFGGDENSQEDMGAFIGNLDSFLRKSGEWNATVLVVHHSGHADKSRSRGSSALKGAVDAEYSATKDENGIVRIEATKMKDAKEPAPVAFKMDVIELDGEDDDGEPITSVALRCVDYAPPPKAGKVGRGKNQTLALSILAELVEEQRRFGPGEWVKIGSWRDRAAAAGIDRKRFYELRKTLEDAGRITTQAGKYVKPIDDERPF
ncbi:AAA family ATPase [Luteimonas mephitis]|uniref:AAA family ATPase n=1 Tax=Luteimonas mephitis TaxID=83615 RepID=UPI003A8CB032